MTYGTATEAKVKEVTDACQRYGESSIIALAGVPGTGKSFIASIAAQRVASDPLMVREIQFHPSFSYEEFVEGMRLEAGGSVVTKPGAFLEWNELALSDPDHTYVLLIEELTRGNLPSLLGELLTFIEYRDRPFLTMYSRRPVKVAKNLVFIATYNPTDRSALELDNALIRRLRIVQCLPDTQQLAEMLAGRQLSSEVIGELKKLFDSCKKAFPRDYEHLMPFGHGIFAEVQTEHPDLHELWEERLRYLLRRPLLEPHPFAEVIESTYPWRKADYAVSTDSGSGDVGEQPGHATASSGDATQGLQSGHSGP